MILPQNRIYIIQFIFKFIMYPLWMIEEKQNYHF